ncbi:MAG: SufS family cysteine desulfurase [Planctomycetales bacterium]|nr:SufS family cysteine desulfurase [Planctomycetales bacterium]MBN8625272.1 SufS family cysteine desulfurase [Planctomycetota bacterium]
MHEVTPDLIAEIATRLYNELPGASVPPKNEIDAGHFGPEALHTAGDYGSFAPSHEGAPSTAGHGPQSPTSYGPGSHGPSTAAPPPGMAHASTHGPTSFHPGVPGPLHLGSHAPQPPQAPRFAANPPVPPTAGFPSGAAAQPGPGSATTTAPPSQYDGLANFVRGIRGTHSSGGTHSSSSTGDRNLGPNADILQRIFAPATLPNESSRPFDVAAIRRDFPILRQQIHGRPLAWFDNAATTQKPQSVIDKISRFYENDNSNIHRGAHTLAARSTDAYEQARQKVQMFLGASSVKEIIFVRGTTEGINLVAKTYGRKFFQPGDEIVLSQLEHHANIVPWQMVARETGAVIRVIPVTDRGEIMLEEYQRILGPRTKFVALTQASNSLGTILPVAEMTQMAKRYNARVLIDGAQSVSHMPVNMQSLGADFFVFSGHKIFGPTGIGVVFAKEEVQEIMPPWQGGGNMIKNVTFEETTYSDYPAKFEAGTPNIADAVGLGAALDYVSKLGLPNIARHEHDLTHYAMECLARINGLRLIGTARDKVSVVSFVLRERRTEEVGKLLDLEGIAVRAGHHCSQPSLRRMGVETTVRPSFSIYNTRDEIDRLVAAVKRIARQ